MKSIHHDKSRQVATKESFEAKNKQYEKDEGGNAVSHLPVNKEYDNRSNLERELDRRTLRRPEFYNSNTDWLVRRRRMKQMLVRGDNVVIAYKSDQEISAWPVSNHAISTTTKDRINSVRKVNATLVASNRVGTTGAITVLDSRQRFRQRNKRSKGKRSY